MHACNDKCIRAAANILKIIRYSIEIVIVSKQETNKQLCIAVNKLFIYLSMFLVVIK